MHMVVISRWLLAACLALLVTPAGAQFSNSAKWGSGGFSVPTSIAAALPVPALVTQAHIVGATGGGTSAAIDTSGCTPNCLIVFGVSGVENTTAITLSDNKGNTACYKLFGLWPNSNSGANQTNLVNRYKIYYCVAPTVGTGHTFTIAGASTLSSAQITVWKNMGNPAIENATIYNNGAGSTLQAGSLTAAWPNSLYITGVSSQAAAQSVNSGFTISDQQALVGGTSYSSAQAYFIQSTPAALNPQWSGLSTGSGVVTVVFKPSRPTPAGCGPDAAPAAAAALGFNCEIYVSDMSNASKFDVTHSNAPGFDWYTTQGFPGAADPSTQTGQNTLASDYTINGSGLHMAPATGNYPKAMFNSCAPTSSTTFVGTTYQAPFYVEFTYVAGNNAILWMTPIEYFIAGPGYAPFVTDELDIIETSPFNTSALHEWSFNANAGTALADVTMTLNASVAGTMSMPPSMLGGTYGQFSRAVNGVVYDGLQYGPTVVPRSLAGVDEGFPAGTWKYLGSSPFCLMMSVEAAAQTMTVSRTAVWTAR